MPGRLRGKRMLNEDYKEMLSCLVGEKVEFIVVGAYALAVHGYPRATGDIDIWVNPEESNAERVYRALARFGASMGGIREEDFRQKGIIFQIGIAPRRIDILTEIDGVGFDEAYRDRIVVNIEHLEIPVLSIEMMIRNKTASGRKKDLLDAELLKNSIGSSSSRDH